MKRKFFATLAMLIIVLVGAFSPVFGLFVGTVQPQVAHAQTPGPEVAGDVDGDRATVDTAGGAGEGDITETAEPVPKEPDELDCGTNFICGGIVLYSYFIQFLPHLFAQISGLVLDYTVWKNLQSDTWTSQDQVESFVVKGWKVVRDFSNLLFIFALFVVAFTLILSGAGSDRQPLFGLDPKRTIARVILMALLINFSFFMCRVIIDMTNLFGNVFYQKISLVDTGGSNSNGTLVSDSANTEDPNGFGKTSDFYKNLAGIRSVSLGILGNINPQKLMLSAGVDFGDNDASWGLGRIVGWKDYDARVYITLIFISSLVGIFDFFLIYLFISSTIFLSIRIFGLFFLIILSPIAFISTAFPQFQKKEYFGFDDWFKQLVGLAFCLPIYLFFLWLAIFFLSVGTEKSDATGYIAISAIIIVKLIATGIVLIMGMKISKDVSGKFGAMASSAVSGVATGAAMIAGAAMTGGTSAALQMVGKVAKSGAISAGRGVGGAIVGDEKAQEWEQKLRGMNGGGMMKRLNNFNPVRDMGKAKTVGQSAVQLMKNFGAAAGEAARMSGSKAPGELNDAYRKGMLAPRAENIKKIREEKAKKVADIDRKIANLTKEFKNPNLDDAGRTAIKDQINDLKKEKWNVQNPSTPATGTAPTAPQPGTGTPAQTIPATPTATTATGPVTITGPVTVTGIVPPTGPTSAYTPEQTKQVVTDIENEMRELEKDLNNPATRLDKNRTQDLEARYSALEQERKDANLGTILPVRLMNISSTPVGTPPVRPRTFGDGLAKKPEYTAVQQERILNKAIVAQGKMSPGVPVAPPMSTKTASLLSGIAGGKPVTPNVSSTATPPMAPLGPSSGTLGKNVLSNTVGTQDYSSLSYNPPKPGSPAQQNTN